MRRGAWLYRRQDSLGQRLLLAPLLPISWLYLAAAFVHRALYRRGLRRAARLSCRVVSLGNVTVGGSAKTPAAAWVARELHRRGHKVVIASRGYGRRGREAVLVVSDGVHVRSSTEAAGDEPLLLAAHAPGVPVLVGRDRAVVGLRAVSAFGADVLVLDDGFQHHRLARDLDVVLVDAALGFGNRHGLPRGPLREPLSALGRADAVGVIGGDPAESDAARIERHAPEAFRFRGRRVPKGLRALSARLGAELEDPAVLAGRRVGMLTGIARPGSLRASLEELGAEVVAERCFPDHHRYRAADVAGLADEAELWVTSEKDAGKILPAWVTGVDVRVLAIRLSVEEPVRVVDWLESRLR